MLFIFNVNLFINVLFFYSKRSRSDEVAELRQSANKSMELVNSLIEKSAAKVETKEDIFCKLLCSELKDLKLPESYDNVTADILAIVRRAKAEERRKYLAPRPTTLYSDPIYINRTISDVQFIISICRKYRLFAG